MEEPEQARVNVRDRCCQSIRGADRGRGRIRPSVRPVCSGFVETCMDTVGGRMYACRSRRCSQPANPSKVRTSELGCVRGLQDRSESSRDETRRGETRRDEARRGETRRARCAMHLVCTRARTQQANKSRRPIHLAEDNIMYLHVCVLKGDEENADLHRGCMSSARQIHPSSPHQTIRHAARYVSMQRVSTVSTKYVAVLNLGDGCLPVDAPVRPTPRRPGRLGRPPHTHSNDCPPNSIANRTSQVPSAR